MGIIGIILLVLSGLTSLVCWIMVLVKMFKSGQTGLGILSIFCAIVAFVWGWIKAGELGLKKIMLAWSVAVVVSIIGNILAAPSLAKLQSDAMQGYQIEESADGM
ncbi:MAG: hypothetical protein KDN22_17580 [Verrucomicrobiae bacterium]|nr:hypothetical protein [Verrucomicrobiae bacterium]